MDYGDSDCCTGAAINRDSVGTGRSRIPL